MTETTTATKLDWARARMYGDWDEDGTASVHLPADVARLLLVARGWDYVGHGCWRAPDGAITATDEALQLALVAEVV